MTKIIVTGSRGFIGQHLSKRLENPNCLPHPMIPIIKSWDYDKMFFLSTYGNMVSHTEHYRMVASNVIDLLSVLKTFKGWLCYMSSSSVTLPVQTPYSRTKRAAEEILQALPELKSCIVRPFSVFGRNEQKEHLIPTLIRSCISGEPMDFAPWPVHDFISVEDVVDALILLSNNGSTGIYELGSGVKRSNQEVLFTVEAITGRKANIRERVKSLRQYDNTEWVSDDFSKRPENWIPRCNFENTIQEMVDDYVKELLSLQ